MAEHSFAGRSAVTCATVRVLKLDKQTWWRKSNGTYTQKTISQNVLIRFCDIWQSVSFYHILSNEKFKMEVEETNFVTHFIITEQ